MDRTDVVAILLIAAVLVVAFSLYRLHRDKQSTFDLSDLITHNDKVDNAKFCQIGAFFVSSWVIYYMTLKGQLTEWALGLYMGAWVGARVASLVATLMAKKPAEEAK